MNTKNIKTRPVAATVTIFASTGFTANTPKALLHIFIFLFTFCINLSISSSNTCLDYLDQKQNSLGPKNTRIYPGFSSLSLGQFRTSGGEIVSEYDRIERYLKLNLTDSATAWSTIRPTDSGFSKGIHKSSAAPTITELYFRENLIGLFGNTGFKNAFLDRKVKIDSSAGINFRVKSQKKEKALIKFRTVKTNKISKELGADAYYEAEFETPQFTDWVFVPLQSFRLKMISNENLDLKGELNQLSEFLAPEDLFLEIGFSSKSKSLKLNISESIGFERGYNGDFRQTLQSLDLEFSTLVYINGDIPSSLSRNSYDPQFLKDSMIKFFESMQNSDSRLYALSVIEKGPLAIEAELNKRGWSSDSSMNGIVELRNFLGDRIRLHLLPIEFGDFGLLHGRLSHHMQFLAGFHKLNEQEINAVSVFMTYFVGAQNPTYWFIWNSLFDSRRSHSIHSNRYWRDLLRESGIE